MRKRTFMVDGERVKVPRQTEVTAELADLQSIMLLHNDSNEIEVRLQVTADHWQINSGDASYDQDHRGYWGANQITAYATPTELADIALELIEEVEEAIVQSQ